MKGQSMSKAAKVRIWLILFVLAMFGVIPDSTAQTDSPSIRFTGFYSLCEKSSACSCADSSYYIPHQLIFRQDGTVYEIVLQTNRDSAILSRRYRRIVDGKDYLFSIGTYRISNDTITAQIPSLFFARGQRWKHFNTSDRGRLVSGSCILDWKAIPPYPPAFRRRLHRSLNGNFESELNGRLFRYEELPTVSILDGMRDKVGRGKK